MLRVGDCELEIRIQYKLERNKLKLKLSDCSELYPAELVFYSPPKNSPSFAEVFKNLEDFRKI